MATATFHADKVNTHSGPAKVWRLDPPVRIDGHDHEFVCIWIDRGSKHQSPEVIAVPSTESGAAVGRSVQRRAGSFVLHTDPDSPDYVTGAHWLALQLLGGYTIAVPMDLDKGV